MTEQELRGLISAFESEHVERTRQAAWQGEREFWEDEGNSQTGRIERKRNADVLAIRRISL